MTSHYKLSIEQFVDHFTAQANAIDAVASDFHKKVLYTIALDPLARAAYTSKGRHNDRVTRLIVEMAEWPDVDRISLPQLCICLREARRSKYRLYREVCRLLREVPIYRKVPISCSPKRVDLVQFAATDDELKAINTHTYASLFYKYRNNLVHEYREPGYGTDWLRKAEEPFYTTSAFGDRELVFPVAFFASVYRRVLANLEKNLRSEKVNAHSRFQFGSYWRSR